MNQLQSFLLSCILKSSLSVHGEYAKQQKRLKNLPISINFGPKTQTSEILILYLR
jgi:hypothetical protein